MPVAKPDTSIQYIYTRNTGCKCITFGDSNSAKESANEIFTMRIGKQLVVLYTGIMIGDYSLPIIMRVITRMFTSFPYFTEQYRRIVCWTCTNKHPQLKPSEVS